MLTKSDIGTERQRNKSLILVAVAFSLDVSRVHADLLVVLFQSGHVLPGFGELAFLHTLANIPKQK